MVRRMKHSHRRLLRHHWTRPTSSSKWTKMIGDRPRKDLQVSKFVSIWMAFDAGDVDAKCIRQRTACRPSTDFEWTEKRLACCVLVATVRLGCWTKETKKRTNRSTWDTLRTLSNPEKTKRRTSHPMNRVQIWFCRTKSKRWMCSTINEKHEEKSTWWLGTHICEF